MRQRRKAAPSSERERVKRDARTIEVDLEHVVPTVLRGKVDQVMQSGISDGQFPVLLHVRPAKRPRVTQERVLMQSTHE